LRTLVQQLERAFAAGQRAEAARLVARVQSVAPGHPLALYVAGVQALHNGDGRTARDCLQQATEKDSANPALWVNLATALRMLGLRAEEMRALERALALEPRHLPALLQMGALLTLEGKPRAAAAVYRNALATIAPGTQLSAHLKPALERAVAAVRDHDVALEAFLDERLRGLRAHYPGTHDRFDHCVDAILGKRRIYVPQPTFMHFPHLPDYEFYPRQDFPWLTGLEAATAEIRAEFERVFAEDQDQLEPYVAYPEGVPLDQWKELNHSRRWSAFYLWREGAPLPQHLARCPRTAAVIEQTPRVDVPKHGPTAFFSILDAHSHIPPHTGVTNTRLTVHLPLVLPGQCAFRVGDDKREWRLGEAWVFDDAIEHEAWNDSDVPRAILIFDVWNPYLTEAERALVRAATVAIGEFNRSEARDAARG
jgi:aspartyl/asparaginyl beta-hydroxylase (cupin superfamily)